MNLSLSEILFYGGIAVMVLAVILAIVFVVIFLLSGQKLKYKLEQEYGKPGNYSSQ